MIAAGGNVAIWKNINLHTKIKIKCGKMLI
jgi:hypothetical protein